MDSTQHQVTEMQDMLIQLQPKLVAATQDVQKMLADVEKESQEVAEFEKVVKVDEAAAQVRLYNSNLRYINVTCTDFVTYETKISKLKLIDIILF